MKFYSNLLSILHDKLFKMEKGLKKKLIIFTLHVTRVNIFKLVHLKNYICCSGALSK